MLREDVMAASKWLGTLPGGAGRDRLAVELAHRISGDTPADAFAWARTVEDPQMRVDALCRAMSDWNLKEPSAAEAAAETLPAEDRRILRKTLEEISKLETRGR